MRGIQGVADDSDASVPVLSVAVVDSSLLVWVPGKGFTELQVNRGTGTSTLALCPRQFGTAEFNAAHDAAIARFPSRGASVCVADTIRP